MKKLTLLMVTVFLFTSVGCSASDSSKEKDRDVVGGITKLDADNGDSSNVEEPQIKDIVEVLSSENSWAYDVTDPLVVMENSDYFLKVRVTAKEKTKYFIKNAAMPASTYNLEVLEVLKNHDGTVPKNIKLAVNGGVVSMQDYVDTMDKETQEKANADKLSKKELKENILINDESYYELKQGEEYYIFVSDLTGDDNYKGYYGMPSGGYNVFEEKSGEYINVLTNLKLDIKK